jgi:hypothetical protein
LLIGNRVLIVKIFPKVAKRILRQDLSTSSGRVAQDK